MSMFGIGGQEELTS